MNRLLNIIIFISAVILAIALIDIILKLVFHVFPLRFLKQEYRFILLDITGFMQVLGIISTIIKFNIGNIINYKGLLTIYLTLAILFLLFFAFAYLYGSSMIFPQLY